MERKSQTTWGHYDGEFPGFSFCFIYPGMGAGEASNLEILTGTYKTSKQTNNPDSSNQRAKKGQPSKMENFETITTLLQPNTTAKNLSSPPPTSGKAKWGAWTSILSRLKGSIPMPPQWGGRED